MAGIFDTLFGGGAEREAAGKNRAQLGLYDLNANSALNAGLNSSVDALRTGQQSADSFLGANAGLYDKMRTAGYGILDANKTAQLGIYDPLLTKYGQGTDLYLDSIGVRGPEGNARAVNAFQEGPGYQFTLDQGLQAINRRRNAGGMLNSGNADVDALTYGTGLANQTYGGWQDRLMGLINPEFQAAGGKSQALQADTLARLNLEQAATGGMAGSNTARAANDVALGNSLAGAYTGDATNRVGIATNMAQGLMGLNNQEAAGKAAGAKNLLGFGMDLGKLAVGAFTGMPGGGGSFGSLFGGGAGGGTGWAKNPWSRGGAFDGGM